MKAVLSPPNNNMLQVQYEMLKLYFDMFFLQLCVQKALKSEFLFAKEHTFPVAVNY